MGSYFKYIGHRWVPKGDGTVTIGLPNERYAYIVAYGLWSHNSISLLLVRVNGQPPRVKTLYDANGGETIVYGTITGSDKTITITNTSQNYDEPLTIYAIAK